MFDVNMEKREFPSGRYRVDAQTDWVLEYLRTRNGKKPFFLFLSYIEPHHQNNHNCYERPIGSKGNFKNYIVPGELEGMKKDWQENCPDYLGCINSLDINLGRILNELKILGLLEDTLIIYTSDNGSHFCTRNSEYKRSCHDGCRVPMIFYGHGFCGGKVINKLVSLIDIPPTILAVAGVEKPEYMKGRPLQEIFTGTAKNWQEEFFLQISESHIGRTIRTKKWKYSVKAPGKNGWEEPDSEIYEEDFLYDLEDDLYERNNLTTDPNYVEICKRLAETLKLRMVQAGEKEPIILPKK